MFYRLLADGVVAIHAGYVLFVVFGLLAIYLGRLLGWQWVHNRWFRCIHFLMIAIVAFEAIGGIDCPLTSWETALRRLAGEEVSDATFVGRMMHQLIIYDLPTWVFNVLHVSFALIVLATFWLVPVRWHPHKEPPPQLAQGKT
jgi:hypothetical protein